MNAGGEEDGWHQGPVQGRRHVQERQPAADGAAQSTGEAVRRLAQLSFSGTHNFFTRNWLLLSLMSAFIWTFPAVSGVEVGSAPYHKGLENIAPKR